MGKYLRVFGKCNGGSECDMYPSKTRLRICWEVVYQKMFAHQKLVFLNGNTSSNKTLVKQTG